MATSKLLICSSASLLLGHNAIAALDGSTKVASLADALYESTRDSILRAHPWNCAVKRSSLTADVTAPTFDWTYRFAVPVDFVRMIQVGELGYEDDYSIEGVYILANTSPLLVKYIYAQTDVTKWDALMVQSLEYALAAKMALPLTGNATLQANMEALFAKTLRQAKAADGLDNPPDTYGDSPLINARFGRRY